MVRARLTPLVASFAAASLLACTDAPVADGPPDVTTGAYYAFIQHGWVFPASGADWRAVGFDFDDDDMPENQAGMLLGALGSLGLAIDDANLQQLSRGDTILGHVVRADSLANDRSVAWQLWSMSGAPPSYDGTDRLGPGAVDGELTGEILAGVLTAQYGEAVIRVPLFPDQPPVLFPLVEARLELDLRGPCRGRIGGVLDRAGLATALDQVGRQTVAHMAAHPEHSFTAAAHQFFDEDHDGEVTASEVAAFGQQLLRADVELDGDGTRDGVSLAVPFECAPALLAAPGEF
ncbi:MAG: hypothetical protein IPL61_19765 [Myxococcales bacterium]|nr:hypothetical protein [Myxococcales bacterium]